MKNKKVSELEIGDGVRLSTGEMVKITNITNGMYVKSKMLFYSNGESGNDLNDTEVEIIDCYTHAQVVAYICDNGHRGLNCTADDFRYIYEDFGFVRDDESGLFTHPTLDSSVIIESSLNV